MEELFSTIAEGWDNGFSEITENTLSTDLISDSISRANDFFFSDGSIGILGESIMLGDSYSSYDDNLYSRVQLDNFGIMGQEALDMALAFEGTNQMLQGMDNGFSIHQGELCSDFMAGIRAGLNNTDVSQMTDFLYSQPYCEGHPLGILRAEVMEDGMNYAHEYFDSHQDTPNFVECLEHFQESQAKEYAEIADLMDERYAADCDMMHYKDLLVKGVDGFDSLEDCEDALRRYFAASSEYGRLSNEISFKSRESMLPYEEYSSSIYDPEHPERNPIGVYLMTHAHGEQSFANTIEKPNLPADFLDRDPKEALQLIQEACNIICDSAGIRRLPVFLTDDKVITDNASINRGFPFTYWDDKIYLDMDYARYSIEKFGTTDSILVGLAHEIGHALILKNCGYLETYEDEKLADMASSILTTMMGIDSEVSREWNLWLYDAIGQEGYPPSEERWDICAVGKYYVELGGNAESFTHALHDKHFRELVYDYKTAPVTTMAQQEIDYQLNEADGVKEKLTSLIDDILKFLWITRTY